MPDKTSNTLPPGYEIRPADEGWFTADTGNWIPRFTQTRKGPIDTLETKHGVGEGQVAYYEGEPVASVTWQGDMLGSAYTHPDHRGKGLFNALSEPLRSKEVPVDAYHWDNPWLRQKVRNWHTSNILDEIHDTLDPRVWDKPAAPEPLLKREHSEFIYEAVLDALDKHGYDGMERWLSLVFTGSLTTYQYSDESDVDVSLFVDTANFPEWSRAEIIAVMVSECDGTTLPGTPFPLQCFVVPPGITRDDLYKPGMRSGYELATDKWIVPPDKSRVHDVEHEMNQSYTVALENADKMDRLLRYEPQKAVQFWHQIHKRRQRDMKAGRGDYSSSNITYKMLANRGLFPQISEVSGEYIARTGMAERTGDPRLDAALAEFMMTHRDEFSEGMQIYQHPEVAWGQCERVSEECAEFLQARGFKAQANNVDLEELGYNDAQKSENVGTGQHGLKAEFTYPEHSVVSVLNDRGIVWWTIDFTASQYGYKEFPKVEPGLEGPLIGPQQQDHMTRMAADYD